jgi:hypothetical protein
MIVVSLSPVNTRLKCDYIKSIQGFHRRHGRRSTTTYTIEYNLFFTLTLKGLLHVHNLSYNEWTISLLRVTTSGSLEHIILKNLLHMPFDDNTISNLTPNVHVEHTMT